MDHRQLNHAPASTARIALRLQIVSDYKLGQARKQIAAQEQAQLIAARKNRRLTKNHSSVLYCKQQITGH